MQRHAHREADPGTTFPGGDRFALPTKFGSLQAFEILGVAPQEEDLASIVKATFQRKNVFLKFRFGPMHLLGVLVLPTGPSLTMIPESTQSFVFFDPVQDTTRHLRQTSQGGSWRATLFG